MVIELSGLQFGLKSYSHVISKLNERAARVWFEITGQYDFGPRLQWRPEVQLPLYYIHFEIAQFTGQICPTMAFCLSFSCNMWLIRLKKPWLIVLFYCPIPNHIARITRDFKMNLIKLDICDKTTVVYL